MTFWCLCQNEVIKRNRVERAKNTELVILLLCPLGSRTYVLLLLITIFIENVISFRCITKYVSNRYLRT